MTCYYTYINTKKIPADVMMLFETLKSAYVAGGIMSPNYKHEI